MTIFYTRKTTNPKNVYTPADDYDYDNYEKCGSLFKLNENLLLLLRIFTSINKMFLIYKKFYTAPLLEVFFDQKNRSFSFYLKIKYDFKLIIFYFTKNIHILKSIYQFLDFFQYSILNSEIKIGKIKKFICLFLKSKDLLINSKNEDNQQNLLYPRNFLKKMPIFDNLSKIFDKKSKKIAYVKVEILTYLKKKLNKIISIRKKFVKLKKMFFILLEKSRKFFIYCPCKFYILSKNKKKYNQKIKKETLLKEDCLIKYSIPTSIKAPNFLLMTKISKRLNLKILFQSQLFLTHFNHPTNFFLQFEKIKTLKNLNLKYNFPIYNSDDELANFLKIKKLMIRSKLIYKKFSFQNFIKKKDKYFTANFFIYRLSDVSTESSFLWGYNKEETKSKSSDDSISHTKSFNYRKFIKKKIFVNNRTKTLILSLFHRIRILTFEINSETQKERNLSRKFHEIKGMELDFQVFTNIIKNLNKIKRS